MNKIYEGFKFDLALAPQSIASNNVTGDYFDMKGFRGACAILEVAALAAGKTCVLEILQATSAAGAGSKGIPTTEGQTAIATVTANAKASEVTVALSTVLATQTVTINGVTYTAHASSNAGYNFSIAGSDSQDADALVDRINNVDYKVPNVTATNNAGTITLKPTDPGATTLTVTASDSSMTVATVKSQAFIEVDAMSLDHDNGFGFIAAKVSTDSTQVVSVTLLRGPSGQAITQAVGDYASV